MITRAIVYMYVLLTVLVIQYDEVHNLIIGNRKKRSGKIVEIVSHDHVGELMTANLW